MDGNNHFTADILNFLKNLYVDNRSLRIYICTKIIYKQRPVLGYAIELKRSLSLPDVVHVALGRQQRRPDEVHVALGKLQRRPDEVHVALGRQQ